jgi:hypothetical protein
MRQSLLNKNAAFSGQVGSPPQITGSVRPITQFSFISCWKPVLLFVSAIGQPSPDFY